MSSQVYHDECIDQTESVCPHCLETVPATIYEQDGKVYMDKVCPEHGLSKVLLWSDAEQYRWFDDFSFPLKPRRPQTKSSNSCPHDCGLCERHERGIVLAEIEVTSRCNQKCPVCFMSAGKEVSQDPSMEFIEYMLKTIYYYENGRATLQITGGEPTVRKDLPDIVRLAYQVGFDTIELNTNGLVLARDVEFLRSLKEAGLTNVYLQFDGLDPEATRLLRGDDLIDEKLKAVENCRREEISVILSPTIVKGVNDDQLGDLIDYAMDNLDVIAGLSIQPAFVSGRFELEPQRHLSLGDVTVLIEEQTDGRIEARDFWPLSCIHPLCGCSTYLVGEEDGYVPLTKELTRADYEASFDEGSPQGSVFADLLAKRYRGRDIPEGLTVLIMSYMDAWTLDLKRLQQCNLGVTVGDGRSIPFCAYHLTDTSGRRLYPIG